MPFKERITEFFGSKERVRRRTAFLEQARDIFYSGREVNIRNDGRIEKWWVVEVKPSERQEDKEEPIVVVEREEEGLFPQKEFKAEELMELNK